MVRPRRLTGTVAVVTRSITGRPLVADGGPMAP
jgi:hypothetical protein